MTFNFISQKTLNFNFFFLISPGKFIFAAFVIFVSAFLYEALKHYREVLHYHTQKSNEIIIKQTDGSFIRSTPKLSLKVRRLRKLLNVELIS